MSAGSPSHSCQPINTNIINKKPQLSLTNVCDACKTIAWFMFDWSYFLLMFNSNYGSTVQCIRDIWRQRIQRPWNLGQGSLKVIESDTIRKLAYGFLLPSRPFYNNLVSKINCFFWDMAKYWSKIAEKPTPLSFGTCLWSDSLWIFRRVIPCQKLESCSARTARGVWEVEPP